MGKKQPLYSRKSLSFIFLFTSALQTRANIEVPPIEQNGGTNSFRGSISFSEAEIAHHKNQISTLVAEAASCARKAYDYHVEFFTKWGISPFFGDNSNFSRMSLKQRVAYLESLKLPASLVEKLESTSCIGFAYKCLKAGFDKTGQSEVWTRIYNYTQLNSSDGSATQFALQKLGWKIYFWNADPNKNKYWDDLEYKEDPGNRSKFWGYHSYRYSTVNSFKKSYLYNPVDDANTLTGFNRGMPPLLARTPFYVGNAHTGYHIFLGLKDRILEGHSTMDITNPDLLEDNIFDPLNPVSPGPSGNYRSGLMALPPESK